MNANKILDSFASFDQMGEEGAIMKVYNAAAIRMKGFDLINLMAPNNRTAYSLYSVFNFPSTHRVPRPKTVISKLLKL